MTASSRRALNAARWVRRRGHACGPPWRPTVSAGQPGGTTRVSVGSIGSDAKPGRSPHRGSGRRSGDRGPAPCSGQTSLLDGTIGAVFTTPGQDGVLMTLSGWLTPTAVWSVDSGGNVADTGLTPRPAINVGGYETAQLFATAKDGRHRLNSGAEGPRGCGCLRIFTGADEEVSWRPGETSPGRARLQAVNRLNPPHQHDHRHAHCHHHRRQGQPEPPVVAEPVAARGIDQRVALVADRREEVAPGT